VTTPAGLRRSEAVGFGGNLTPSPRQLRKWTPGRYPAGTMLGFLSVELSSGLIIKDLRLIVGPNAGVWITMPARQQMDRDGRPGRSANGKPIWSDFIEFQDKATRDRFEDQFLELTRTEHPKALRSGQQ
jgi:DNA-binding cell septation regulator SpoVG